MSTACGFWLMNMTSPRALSFPSFLPPLAGIEPTTSTRCWSTSPGTIRRERSTTLDGRIDDDLQILLLGHDLRRDRDLHHRQHAEQHDRGGDRRPATVSSSPVNEGSGNQSGRTAAPRSASPAGATGARSERTERRGAQPLLRAPASGGRRRR